MASEEYKESDLSKIVKRLMDEEGFEFGEAVREAMEQTKNFESKADGGSIGIEVLFTDKMANGGRVPMVSGGALKTVGSGIMKLFGKGDDVVDLAKQEEIFRSGDITTDFLENVDDKVIKKFVATRDAKGPGGYGLYDSFDDMPNGLKAAELISRIKNAEGGINYEAAELFIGKKLKGNETVNELISMVVTEKKADGGRVGLFMGGPALEGPALGIYNSMKAYQSFTDQEIADAIRQAGYELPTADSGTTPPGSTPQVVNQLGYQSGNERQGGIMDLDPYSNAASPRNQSNTSSKYSVAEIEKGIDIYGNPIDESITSKGFIGSAMDKFSNLPGIKQGKNLINTIMDNTLVGRLAAMRNPLNPNASNYNPSLQGQIDMLGGITGSRITGTSGNLKTTEGLAMIGRDPNSGLAKYGAGSVLAGQNVVSGFGTNDYEDQLQGYIDKMISRGTLSQFQKAKLDQAYKELEKAQQGALERVDALNKQKAAAKAAGEAKKARDLQIAAAAKTQEISRSQARQQQAAIERDQQRDSNRGGGANQSGGGYSSGSGYNEGNYCFDPSTPIQMADGSIKKIKNIQLGDNTKGGEVTGVFQFKASDEIHDYKGVTVAGSHYVKEDGKFIMVKDSPLSVKIDKIPVVYSLDTTGRRIFINDIEFADYNGDGVAKNFLTNAGVDLTGFDTEVLRQVENRLI